jgi:tetrapyrrole methylase family protein/MazG family protein
MAAAEHDATPQPVPTQKELSEHFQQLVAIVEHLRSPQGCPWDRAQTPQSLLPYLLEEVYEVMESVENGNDQGLKEELGDLLLHILLQSRMAQEAGHFALDDTIRAITEKLIRRHPHVFGAQPVRDAAAVQQHWEAAKQREKGRRSLLDGLPRALPALLHACRVQEKAASVGFDWDDIAPVWAKVVEELAELQEAYQTQQAKAVEEEFGDLLFTLVNLGRFLHLHPETALRKAAAKFERRFRGVEDELARRGRRLEDASLQEMDAIWNRFRQQE